MNDIITVCVIVITVILLVRSLVELYIVVKLAKKAFPLLEQFKEIAKNVVDMSRYVKDEAGHVKETVRSITNETKESIDQFKEVLSKVTQNFYVLNSVLQMIVDLVTRFFKKGDKEKPSG